MSSSRSWKDLGICQRAVQHSRGGGRYKALAINQDGLIAVTDESNKHVHLIAGSGKLVKTFKKEKFSDTLGGVTFDGEGNVWVSDSGNDRVMKFSQNGRLLHIINHLSNERERLNHPTDVAVSRKGHIYICDYGDHHISVHNESGQFMFMFGSKGGGDGQFDGPLGLTFAPDGLLYVCDRHNSRVCAYQELESQKPRVVREFSTQFQPARIASTNDGHLIVTSTRYHKIMVYTTTGDCVCSFGEHGAKRGQLDCPCGVAVDSTGNIFVAEGGSNKRIQVFS